jgi:hypothetical protein
MINTIEMTSQEAAWTLFREPMSHKVEYIPTVWTIERQRIKKTQNDLDKVQVGEDSTNISKDNWFDKYEKRPQNLENVSQAQFVAYYNIKQDGTVGKKTEPRTIRYRCYDIQVSQKWRTNGALRGRRGYRKCQKNVKKILLDLFADLAVFESGTQQVNYFEIYV